MANPFIPDAPPVQPVPTIQQVVAAILNTTKQQIPMRLQAYRRVQMLIWANPHFKGDDVVAALGEETYAFLQMAAVVDKTSMNYIVPGTIVDTVPEATITMPK